MTSTFITGGTGFIGGALAAHLRTLGWQVTLGVRPGSVHKLSSGHPYQVVAIPLKDASVSVLRDQVIFHAAAIRNRWGTPESRYQQVNVEGTRALLEAAVQGDARRFVYLSSVGVYGWPGLAMMDENTPVDDSPHATPYHRSKIAAEHVVRSFAGQLEIVIVRPTITCGPGDRDGMLTRLLALLSAGRFVPIGRGKNTIHLTDIADLCAGLTLAGTHPQASGETFILSGPQPVQMRSLLKMAYTLLGKRAPAFFIPTPLALSIGWAMATLCRRLHLPGEPLITVEKVRNLTAHRGFSHAKATRVLNYHPKISIQETLHRTLAWMRHP